MARKSVAYPTKVPMRALRTGKRPGARAKMLDSGRGYHEPAALELIEGYHGQQKQPQATWSIRSNLIHTTHPRRDSQSTKLIVLQALQELVDSFGQFIQTLCKSSLFARRCLIPIPGAGLYYDEHFLAPEEATQSFNALLSKCAW